MFNNKLSKIQKKSTAILKQFANDKTIKIFIRKTTMIQCYRRYCNRSTNQLMNQSSTV